MSSFHNDQVLGRLRVLVLEPTMTRDPAVIRNQVFCWQP
jgi:hypothetical protein